MKRLHQSSLSAKTGRYLTLTLFAIFFALPIVYTVMNSLMSPAEVQHYYSGSGQMTLHLLPDQFSLEEYYQILFRQPDYLMRFFFFFWPVTVIVIGQVCVSSAAGFAFAKFRFPGRDVLFFFVIILMMPIQVTLVSNYIVLDRMGLIGTYFAIILPAIFSPFGVFLMRQVIATMPDELIEAAKLDGAGNWRIFLRIVLPCSKSGVVSLVILCFIDNWNMVEQPIVCLKDAGKYPLSVFLSQINEMNPGLSFACGVLAMVPVALLFLFYEKELIEGIGFSNLK